MLNIQSIIKFCKKPAFILLLILSSFFLKEVFIADTLPIFEGQDEARHYNTVQYLTEPKEKNWKIKNANKEQDKNRLETYRFSEEIKNTITATGINAVRVDQYSKLPFSESYNGKNENLINEKKWEAKNKIANPDVVAKPLLYHSLASYIEKFFQNTSILVRFYLIRIFSILLGTLAILTAFFIARNIGFSQKHSLILTAIFSFQPKLSIYFSNINYDSLLIPLFMLFALGGVLSLKDGLNWKNSTLMLIATALGFFTKGISLVLAVVFIGLVSFYIYNKIKIEKKKIRPSLIIFIAISIVVAIFLTNFRILELFPYKNNPVETVASLGEYLSKSLSKISSSSRNYWGSLDWIKNDHSQKFVWLIWMGEVLALAGFAKFFIFKKTQDYLPQKKYILFLISMMIALQLGVRTYDWKIYIETGSLLLGTPGRYFLPTLFPHILLIFIGIGMFFKKKIYFERSLIFGLILMFSFSMYIIFNVIVPRYYL